MIELVKAGDVTFQFDWKTSSIVVEAFECEVGRVKVNELMLAYNDKVTPCFKVSAELLARSQVSQTDNKLPTLKSMLDSFGARLLEQREKAWADGDRLAGSVMAILQGRLKAKEALDEALNRYATEQGWSGPACSLLK